MLKMNKFIVACTFVYHSLYFPVCFNGMKIHLGQMKKGRIVILPKTNDEQHQFDYYRHLCRQQFKYQNKAFWVVLDLLTSLVYSMICVCQFKSKHIKVQENLLPGECVQDAVLRVFLFSVKSFPASFTCLENSRVSESIPTSLSIYATMFHSYF